jgi:hypothetical protein
MFKTVQVVSLETLKEKINMCYKSILAFTQNVLTKMLAFLLEATIDFLTGPLIFESMDKCVIILLKDTTVTLLTILDCLVQYVWFTLEKRFAMIASITLETAMRYSTESIPICCGLLLFESIFRVILGYDLVVDVAFIIIISTNLALLVQSVWFMLGFQVLKMMILIPF